MSSIGGGDTLQALLNVIADPKAHQAMLDAQNASKAAADEAGAKLALMQKQIAEDKAALKKERAALDGDVAAFAAEKKTILDQVKGFAEREKYLADGDTKLATDKSNFLTSSTAKQTELDQREAAVKKSEDILNDRLEAVKALETKLAASQADLDQKLGAIRALAR